MNHGIHRHEIRHHLGEYVCHLFQASNGVANPGYCCFPAMESILVTSNLQGDRVTCLNIWWVLATTFTILELAYDLHMPTAQMTYTLEDLKQKWKVTPPKKKQRVLGIYYCMYALSLLRFSKTLIVVPNWKGLTSSIQEYPHVWRCTPTETENPGWQQMDQWIDHADILRGFWKPYEKK